MLSKVKFQHQHFNACLRYYCSTININLNKKPFRVAMENENHDVMSNSESFKYKTQANENFLSQNHSVEQNTSVVEKIQVFSSSDLNTSLTQKMSEARDRLGQWPIASESEIEGQGLTRLRNGRYNKVSSQKFWKKKLNLLIEKSVQTFLFLLLWSVMKSNWK